MNKSQMLDIMTDHEQVRSIERRIANLRESLERITAQLNGMPRGSGGADKMAAMTAKIVDLTRELDEKRIDLEIKAQEVERRIDSLPDRTQRRIMRLRYVDGLPWKKIIKITHYEIASLMAKQRKALKELEK